MTGFVIIVINVVQTHFIEISKSYWNLAVVTQNVLDSCLGAVHHSVGDSLSQTGLRLGLLLHPEVEDDRLDGDALEENQQLLSVHSGFVLNQPARPASSPGRRLSSRPWLMWW